jgi:hypothetical protein
MQTEFYRENRRPRRRSNNNAKMYFFLEWGVAESRGIVASNEAIEPTPYSPSLLSARLGAYITRTWPALTIHINSTRHPIKCIKI